MKHAVLFKGKQTMDKTEDSAEKEEVSDQEKSEDVVKRRPNYRVAGNPPTTEMVKEALIFLNEPKGSTVVAIRKFVIDQFGVKEGSAKHLMRNALTKLVKNNSVKRPKGDEEKSVLLGRYILGEKSVPKFTKRTAILAENENKKQKKPKKKKKRSIW